METDYVTTPSTIPDHVRKKPGPKPKIRLTPDPPPPVDLHSNGLSDLSYAGFLHSDKSSWIDRYRSIPLPEVLFELGQLRKISEIAAEQANRRTTPDETKCWICSTPHPANSKWTMIYPDRDPITGTTVNRFIDTISCANELQLRLSKAKLAAGQTPIKGLPDRGMVKGEGS